jgi:AcrR family transcriptional regulator
MRQIVTDRYSLTAPQRRAVEAVLTHTNVTSAAASLGCSRAALYRHLRHDAVQAALRDAQRQIIESTLRNLNSLSDEAVAGLATLLQSDIDTVRLSACRLVLELSLKYTAQIDIERRLQAIEDTLDRGILHDT